MKIIDKLIKILKTDRNTFFTYILTLFTAYFMVDRIVEILFICFSGISISYWGPITYTIALACPVFAYFFSGQSKFAKSDKIKIQFFYALCVSLYVIAISMVVQYTNRLGWLILLSAPNYKEIFLNFSDLIIPAFTSVAIYIPATTFYKLLKWLYTVINDPIFPNNLQESITDYPGIDLSPGGDDTGPFSFETVICKNKGNAKPVTLLEKRRFESMLIVGSSGCGKTSMVLEPMIARDIEKKYFFKENAKEMGYAALKAGLATLNCPFDNDYINENFKLSMLTPVEGKEKAYKSYMKKMIYYEAPNGKIVYKDLGIISVTPDYEHTSRLKDVAKAFNIPVTLIDPLDANSIGLNPFIIEPPALCAIIISSIIRSLYSPAGANAKVIYAESVANQAIQNLVILLKVMYPRLNNGLMPTLEDLLKCFNDFDYVEYMCREMEKIPEFATEYELQIGYFKQYFYSNAYGKEDMKMLIHFPASTLDILLRAGSVRNIICNRHHNIDFTKSLNNGEVVLLCTRPYEIGGAAHAGFGRFFLALMMCSVEVVRGSEKERIPNFLYVDEFNLYVSPFFTDMFTLYRKFKIGTVFTTQTISQIGDINSALVQSLLTNCPTKITFGNHTPEDFAWWEKEFGKRREWAVANNYDKSKGAYSDNLGNVEWKWKDGYHVAKLQGLAFKTVVYKTKDKKGKNIVSFGKVDFLEPKYKEPHKAKTYKFDKFTHATSKAKSEDEDTKSKFNPKSIDFDTNDDIDPIQTDTDSSYFFNNEDAITYNFKPKKNN